MTTKYVTQLEVGDIARFRPDGFWQTVRGVFTSQVDPNIQVITDDYEYSFDRMVGVEVFGS
jgi:hypothetical protein